jgi:HK97 family phage major capsid protein
MTIEALTKSFGDFNTKVSDKLDDVSGRVGELEKRSAREPANDNDMVAPKTWGNEFVHSKAYQDFAADGFKGKAKLETKAAVTTTGTGAPLINPERDPNGVLLPRRRMTIRTLLGQGRTGSSSVEYFRESVFTNNAGMVAETTQKPESVVEYTLATAPVRTIAHWIPASRQAMEDAPQLATLIDGSLRYGLEFREEAQFLYGSGTGENLFGMVPQATAYQTTRTKANSTALDVIRNAISQAEEADLPASGVILNTSDYYDLLGIKDAGGNFMIGNPLGSTNTPTIWSLNVVRTNALLKGTFLVGAFDSATQLYDRMDPEVLASDQDRDNFIKNMLTIRAEKRLAFAVKRPAAIITGNITGA